VRAHACLTLKFIWTENLPKVEVTYKHGRVLRHIKAVSKHNWTSVAQILVNDAQIANRHFGLFNGFHKGLPR